MKDRIVDANWSTKFYVFAAVATAVLGYLMVDQPEDWVLVVSLALLLLLFLEVILILLSQNAQKWPFVRLILILIILMVLWLGVQI
ncbi:MAG: hypothetical protein HKN16_01320 [Saprospiraceae bacterium]|nr:hypothetical protein [Saprospiraceae bacterium]